MANIKIEIDTESSLSKSGSGRQALTTTTTTAVGLLSSIPLSLSTIGAFGTTVGTAPQTKAGPNYDATTTGLGYNSQNIVKGAMYLQTNFGCTVLATAGGLVTCNALITAPPSANIVPFVSIVGDVPQSLGNCKGGVTLQSYYMNIERQNWLTQAGCTTLILLTNQNSAMHGSEKTKWGAPTATRLFVESYAGKGGGNDASKLTHDFNGGGGYNKQIPTGANTGIIVSDDPFFGSNATRAILINLINGWIGADATKFVVYPSQLYASALDSNSNPVTPMANQSVLMGPDMVGAYGLLGVLANYLVNNASANVGFFPAGIQMQVVQ